MVLSCSLRDFLSPPGMEIRLGLCKRIFYFSFFPPWLSFFFHVRCPKWPLRKSNLYFFFSLTKAFFFLRYLLYHRHLSCGFLQSRILERPFFFFRLQEGENHGFQLFLPSGPNQQKFNFEMKPFHRTLARLYNIKMDLYQLMDWWAL